jgi:5'-3' exonuclease
MGIEGLLRNLQPILESPSLDPLKGDMCVVSSQNSSSKKKTKVQPIHNIREFVNCSIAIDASSWLHKAGYSISESLVEAVEQEPSDWQRNYPHIVLSLTNYMVKRCDELFRYAGIARITLVYDGERRCPLKVETNDSRNSKREANLAKARLLKTQGRLKEASELYRACVKVPFSLTMIAMQKIMEKNKRLSSIVAPFEADAQLAKLCLDGNCQAVITEDSDLLVYSAAVGVPFPIIFKLDRNTGACDVISMRWLFPPPSISSLFNKTSFHEDKENLSPNLTENYLTVLKMGTKLSQYLQTFRLKENGMPGYGRRLFVQACVLAGCDYTVNSTLAPDGIGLITACKLIAAHAHRSHEERFLYALREYKGSGANTSTTSLEDYAELLAKSEAVFYYHYVYCTSNKTVLPLQPLQEDSSTLHYNEGGVAKMEEQKRMQMPNMHRFQGSTSFLGSNGIPSNCQTSPTIRFRSADTDKRGWISKKSNFFSTSHQRTSELKKQDKATQNTGIDIRAVLQEINHKPKPHHNQFLNFQKHQVQSKEKEREEGNGADRIVSVITSINGHNDSVCASEREISSSLSVRLSPRESRCSSSKVARWTVSTETQSNNNRFISFAHEAEAKPSFSFPTVNLREEASLNRHDTDFKRKLDDNESVPSSVPQKLSKNFNCSTGTRHLEPYSDQFVESSPEFFIYSMDADEEVPSSYPKELEKKAILTSPFQRVSTGSPCSDQDSIDSRSVYSSSSHGKKIMLCMENQCEMSKVNVDNVIWTDEDSDCCIVEDRFIPIHGVGVASNVNSLDENGRSEGRISCDYFSNPEQIITQPIFPPVEHELSFSNPRKKLRTCSIKLSSQPKSAALISNIARTQNIKGGRQTCKLKSLNHTLPTSWLQPLKGRKCRTERSIKDFFLPLLPKKRNQP